MPDVVIKLPLESDQEADLFSSYLNSFMHIRREVIADLPEAADAPYLMVHSDRRGEREVKVLTFQNLGAARAFSAGWRRARDSRRAEAL
ncbi:MAG TPA: hypothetical protein VKT30_07690 [Caulobacteraceae bacterium]|nr:hypothetical protein [Caulobacteraceae bacterium]